MDPVTRTLIVVNVVAFCFEGIFGDAMIVHLALWPIGRARVLTHPSQSSPQSTMTRPPRCSTRRAECIRWRGDRTSM
jgi:hypothetical protein